MSKSAEVVDAPIRIDSPVINDRKAPSCCFCLDVRIGAVMIGLMNLIAYAVWIISTSQVLIRHKEFKEHWQFIDDVNHIAEKHSVDHQLVGMMMACLCFIIVTLLIYGAALRRASYILPFFCLQVFDICLTVLFAATIISYAPQLKYHLETSSIDGVHSECVRNMTLTHFRIVLVLFWLCVLMIKYYFASVIWDCYCHCKKVEERRVQTDPQAALLLYQENMETMNLLPSYDDVIKTSPPPAYVVQ